MSRGIIVLGHGSRAEVTEANDAIFVVAELVKQKTSSDLVEAALMNRSSNLQSVDQAAEVLIQKGVKEIVLAPWFLTKGAHIQSDIPRIIARVQERFPGVQIVMAPPLGPDPKIVDVLLERVQEVEDGFHN